MEPRNQRSKFLACAMAATVALMLVVLLVACASKGTAPVTDEQTSKLITDIQTGEDATATTVTVKGNQPLTYTAVKQDFPQGVLFHFPNTALDNINNVYYPPDNQTIGSIRASEVEDNGKTTRIFIALKQDVPYSLNPDGSNLQITFPHAAKSSASAPTAAAAPPAKKAAAAPAPKKVEAPAATMLKRITTKAHSDHLAIKVLANGMVIDHKSFTLKNPDRIVFDLMGVGSPYKTTQSIAVKSKFASKIRHFGHPTKLRVVIETNRAYFSKYNAVPVNDGLLIHIGDVPAQASSSVTKPAPAPVKKSPVAAKKTCRRLPP